MLLERRGVRVKRIMRLHCCEATKQELVALDELLFCLRPFDYLGGSRGFDFTFLILILL